MQEVKFEQTRNEFWTKKSIGKVGESNDEIILKWSTKFLNR